jgi:hypothetical protein
VQVVSLDGNRFNFDEKPFGVLFGHVQDEPVIPRVAKSARHRADVGFEHEMQRMVLGQWSCVSSDTPSSKVSSVGQIISPASFEKRILFLHVTGTSPLSGGPEQK